MDRNNVRDPLNDYRLKQIMNKSLASLPQVHILGVRVDALDMDESLDVIDVFLESGRPHYVVTPNLHFIALADKDLVFRQAVNNADLCIADGVPLLWIARLMHSRLKGRVNGTDFVHAICSRLATTPRSIFLLGTTEEIGARAAKRLKSLYPGLKVAGLYSPPFGEFDHSEIKKIRNLIDSSGADLVFVAFGNPKQEVWMAENYDQIQASVCIAIGGSLDFIAGAVKRAPRWMQRAGLEWLFRIIVEPKRLAGRYGRDVLDLTRIIVRRSRT